MQWDLRRVLAVEHAQVCLGIEIADVCARHGRQTKVSKVEGHGSVLVRTALRVTVEHDHGTRAIAQRARPNLQKNKQIKKSSR